MADFPALVAVARRRSGMTAAEFDYSLAFGGEENRARAALADAAYTLATEGLPVVDTTTPVEELARRIELGHVLLYGHRASIESMTVAAKAKTYTGWSSASRGPIRYAN